MKIHQSMLFERPGRHNTDRCMEAVRQYVAEHGKTHVVVVSTTGTTAMAFAGV
ncbi:MAG: hypothetical protein GYA83_08265 [Deltaproteobacteria bacterium]|nr:hypothetical protein [Deltaproteobacteria bacterium]